MTAIHLRQQRLPRLFGQPGRQPLQIASVGLTGFFTQPILKPDSIAKPLDYCRISCPDDFSGSAFISHTKKKRQLIAAFSPSTVCLSIAVSTGR
jgi:hypothetical protein